MKANKKGGQIAPAQSHQQESTPQPEPFTPGLSKAAVRQHAYELYRDKLNREGLTLQDWVLAEKDLVNSTVANNVSQ